MREVHTFLNAPARDRALMGQEQDGQIVYLLEENILQVWVVEQRWVPVPE